MRRTTRPLNVVTLGLLMLCAVAPAMARNGVNAAANGEGPCVETQDAAIERARQTAESHGKAPAPTVAKPAARAATGTMTRGGGGDDSTPLRSHGAKWHSFLPGMFR